MTNCVETDNLKRRFGHFHDYYSRTYPKYESYTSRERECDLYTMMKTISQNEFFKVEDKLYYSKDGGLNPVFKSNVLCAVGNSISTTLSGPIIQEITMILSSTEAAVALSAPVVNLITNSKEIHTNTINVMAEALSTGVVSSQVECAVGNAISSDALQPQMFTATEKVLSTDEISSAMI